MEKKFTDGPWRYTKENGSATTGQHMIAGGKPGYLAEVRDCGGGDVSANAHIIAAAPCLFEALEWVVKEFGIRGGDGDDLLPACKQPVCVASAMRILDKALGKS